MAAFCERSAPGLAPGPIRTWAGSAAISVIFAVGGFAPVVAAAPDAVAVIRLLAEQDSMVLRVGERLVTGGAPLCRSSGRSAGMTVQQLSQYGAEYRTAAHSVLGIANRPTVALVTSGGSAAAAGVRPGDVIAAIDGHSFADVAPRGRAGAFGEVAAAHDVIDAALADGRSELTVLRDRQPPRTLVVIPRPACRARFDVRAGRSNNASADGTYVQVSSDLVGRARGDGELAAILAHELAHNILEHHQRLHASGARPSVRTTEIEADRLSVYLLDAAGYAPADAVAFWARWGRANDLGIFSDRTHPGWRKRIAAIEAEAAVIGALKAAGKPVTPPADLRRPG